MIYLLPGVALVVAKVVAKPLLLLHKKPCIVFGKGHRKTAARTLFFLAEAVSGSERPRRRPGANLRERTLSAPHCLGNKSTKKNVIIF